MSLTNAGRDFLVGAAMGIETQYFNEANSYICVGNGTAAFHPDQTDLMGTETYRKKMDEGFPTRNGNVMNFKATFNDDEANFAWDEWGVANDATGGVLLNRIVEYNGTKMAGQTWIFEVELTLRLGSK